MKLLMEWMEKNEIILWIGLIQRVHMKSNLLTRLVLCQIYQLLAYGWIKNPAFQKRKKFLLFKGMKALIWFLRYNFNQKKYHRFVHRFIHQWKQENNSFMKCNQKKFYISICYHNRFHLTWKKNDLYIGYLLLFASLNVRTTQNQALLCLLLYKPSIAYIYRFVQ